MKKDTNDQSENGSSSVNPGIESLPVAFYKKNLKWIIIVAAAAAVIALGFLL
jgi:hypothetical protein